MTMTKEASVVVVTVSSYHGMVTGMEMVVLLLFKMIIVFDVHVCVWLCLL